MSDGALSLGNSSNEVSPLDALLKDIGYVENTKEETIIKNHEKLKQSYQTLPKSVPVSKKKKKIKEKKSPGCMY